MPELSLLLLAGLGVAVFVGFNIGGSSTGVAFGPAVGSNVLTKTAAAVLMVGFAFLGGATVGRNVIRTMSTRIVPEAVFSIEAAVIVLFFTGAALLISNLFGVPASTSMTAVGAIAGLGVATEEIRWGVMGGIVSWWLVAPILAFWVCAVIGRYLYPHLEYYFAIDQSEEPVFGLDRSGARPRPWLNPDASARELVGTVLVVAIACYMAFSAGASNVANAVAPLVGNGVLRMNEGILLAGGAIGLGAFTIARRTLDTVGNDLTELPLLAALIVEAVSASIITMLSQMGVPASLAVSATMSVIGLGWGRATRTTTIADAAQSAVRGDDEQDQDRAVSVEAIAADVEDEVPAIGEEEASELVSPGLFNPSTNARVITMWMLTPSVSALGSYCIFEFTPVLGL